MSGELFAWLSMGAILGFVTSLPIGPINLTFATVMARGEDREGLALAAVVGLLDGGYALAALSASSSEFFPFSPSPLLQLLACAFLIGYGASLLIPRSTSRQSPATGSPFRGPLTGAILGMTLYLLNPTFPAFWLSAAITLRAKFPAMAALTPRLCFAMGVNAGVGLWFTALRALIRRRPFPWPILHRLAQGMGLSLIGLGAYLLMKRL